MDINWFNVVRYGGDFVLCGITALAAYLVWQRGNHGVRRGRRGSIEDDDEGDEPSIDRPIARRSWARVLSDWRHPGAS